MEFHWKIITEYSPIKDIVVTFVKDPKGHSVTVYQWIITMSLERSGACFARGVIEGYGTIETIQRLFVVPQSIVKEIMGLSYLKSS